MRGGAPPLSLPSLDRTSGRRYPLTRQLADELRRRIQLGTLGPGERLPPVRALALDLDVTPETVANAYRLLVGGGYLRGEVGRGTFVAAPPLNAEENPLAPFQAGGALPPFASASAGAGPPPNRVLLRLANQPGVVSFAASVAAYELAPVEALRVALDEVLDADGAAALRAGPAEGYAPLRESITHLLRERGVVSEPGSVCITSGSQQGIDLAAKVFVGQGDTVLVEQPTFMGALEAFRVRGARVVGVPVDAEGLRVDGLAGLMARHRPKLLYCMPTFQNPTGRSMAPERRQALLRIAAAHDLPIVEDDSSGFFPLEAEAGRPSALKADDHAGHVIYLGTFSKLLAAGMRLGWLVASPAIFEKLVAAKYATDLSSDVLLQRAMQRLLASGVLAEHLARVRQAYRERRDALVAALAHVDARFEPPAGGFNLWLELPPGGPSSTDLYLEAVRRGVAFVPGAFFFVPGERSPIASATHGLRLCYAAVSPPEITRGVRLLTDAMRAVRGTSQARTARSRQPEPVVY